MRKSEKLPAMMFYPGDWLKDEGVQSLSYEMQGIWFTILLYMHNSTERGVLLLNGVPYPTQALARLLRLDNQNLETCLTTLLNFGVVSKRESDGALYSRRMVRDEEISKIRKSAGLQGGNPKLLKQKSSKKKKQDNQIPEYEYVNENEVETVIESKSIKKEVRPFVWLTDQESEKYILEFGVEFLNRCSDKLSAWIEQDPTPKRKKNGRNASATFRSWVFNAVSEEQSKASRLNSGNHQQAKKAFNTLQTEKNLQALAEVLGK